MAFDFVESILPKIGASFSFDLTGGGDEDTGEEEAVDTEGERRGALRKASSEKPNSGTVDLVSFRSVSPEIITHEAASS